MSDRANLVRVLTSATGTGTMTLGAAYSQLFMTSAEANMVDGRTYTYLIVDGNNWELGKGVYTASGTTLSRVTVLASRISSTLGTTKVTLSGTAQVRIIESADDMGALRGTRAVTGTSDTLAQTDLGRAVTYSNAAAIAVSLAQAGASSSFLDGWSTWVQNLGAGAVTITPATSTINGAATLVLVQNLGAFIWSDGTNYHAYFVPITKPLLAANNLSEVVAATARANLAAQAQGDYAGMSNGTLVASASSGALTVAVKTFAGADPSAGDPVYFYFRNSTLTSGDFTRIAVTAALSVVLGSTKTLGASSATGVRVWIAAFNNAGTVQLGAINCSDAAGVFCPAEHVKYTTAVPGNSAKTFYSTSAIGTAAPWRFIGFCEWTSLTTAGTWVAPDAVQLFGPGVKRPGDVVQVISIFTLTVGSRASASLGVLTNTPTAAITPTSASNLIRASVCGTLNGDTASGNYKIQLSSGTTAIGPQASLFVVAGAPSYPASLTSLDKPNTTSTVTYQVQGIASSGTLNFPVTGGGANYELVEIMG